MGASHPAGDTQRRDTDDGICPGWLFIIKFHFISFESADTDEIPCRPKTTRRSAKRNATFRAESSWLKALDAIIITGMSRPLPPPASRLCFWEDRKGLACGQTEAEAETEATAAEKGRVREMSNEYYSRWIQWEGRGRNSFTFSLSF